jgi:hypothetical protein
MDSRWLGSLKDQERENMKNSIQNSKLVLDKLHEIVYNMYSEHRSTTFKDYDSPAWLAKQAHTNGYCEALSKILELTKV